MKREIWGWNVGIDISKDDFKACICFMLADREIKVKSSRSFKNHRRGFEEFQSWVSSKLKDTEASVSFTMEATGVYYESLAYFLYHSGLYVSVLLPNMAKNYAKSLNLKSKTDKVDAKMLGYMGLERRLNAWEPMSSQMYILKKYSRERSMLVASRTATTNRIHAEKSCHSPNADFLKRAEQRKELQNKQIKQVEKAMKQAVKKDKELKQRIDNICTVNGLGFISVVCVVAETNGFALFRNQSQLTSYAGYDVVHKESGTKKGKTYTSKRGNSDIRGALYMPALTAIRHNPEMKAFFERVFYRSFIYKKANVAVQRKLLILIYTLFRKNEPYDPTYNKKDKLVPVLGSVV